ncbi:MAG: hypothetical protein ACYDD6_07045 [Acidimicrobiales bacterium]
MGIQVILRELRSSDFQEVTMNAVDVFLALNLVLLIAYALHNPDRRYASIESLLAQVRPKPPLAPPQASAGTDAMVIPFRPRGEWDTAKEQHPSSSGGA